jgi:hypothetical protein
VKTTERNVHFYDLIMSSTTRDKNVPSPSLCPLRDILIAMSKTNPNAHVILENSKEMIEVADWKYDNAKDYLKILINRADRDESDVAFKKFSTRSVRKGGKTTEEGIDYSAHVIISPIAAEPKGFVLITMGAGITTYAVEKLLNQLMKIVAPIPANAALFNFPHPSGALNEKGKASTYKVRYGFECVSHKSALLDEALKDGSFVGLELVAHQYSQFDAGGNLQVQQQTIAVSAQDPTQVTAATVRNAIKKYMGDKPAYPFDHVRVRFKGGAGEERTTTLPTNDLNAAFTRKETLQLPEPVEQQQSHFSAVVIAEMEKLL